MKRDYAEINEKIASGKIRVVTAFEAKTLIKEKGINHFEENVDIVTCASFEMNTNALLYLSFGQTDPLIYFKDATINNVPAYPVGPTDLVLSCIASSASNPQYGGAHVIEELVKGKDVHLKANGKPLEVFINNEFETWFNLKEVNQCRLILNQAVNQNNIVATNSGNVDINSNMGTLIAKLENSTYNSSSFLNPLINDPYLKTIGVGSKIWIAGTEGYISGEGSNHNPKQKRNEHEIPLGPAATLSVIGDLNFMDSKWIKGGYIKSFGPVLYIGIGIAIPVLDSNIAKYLSITDDKIHTTIVDFSIPRRAKPTFGNCTYEELRTSTVIINEKPTLSAPLSSMALAIDICKTLKSLINEGKFTLIEPSASIDLDKKINKMDARLGELV